MTVEGRTILQPGFFALSITTGMMKSKFNLREIGATLGSFLLTGFVMASGLVPLIYPKIIFFVVSIPTVEVILITSRKDFSAVAYLSKYV